MGNVLVNLRMPEELLDAIKATTDNPSEAIRDSLTREYMTSKSDAERIAGVIRAAEDEIKLKPKHVEAFSLPVGDVLCRDTPQYRQTQVWWCPSERLAQVRELSTVWCENGFKFCIGERGHGTLLIPEVIETPEQERRRNGRFSPSTKMYEAHVGDRQVWLEVIDPVKALEFMKFHTDIPCAVRCDVHRYSYDKDYIGAFDKANELFIYYFCNGRPKREDGAALRAEDILKLYDL